MNYPNGIKKELNHISSHKSINYSNRGMTLESELNDTNEYYRFEKKAYIYKKPTPIKITKVDYPSRDKAIIKEAFFTIPSTTDYNGLYQGRYIDFEAKETKSKTAFTLRNIHEHQIKHIKDIYENNGIVFLIIRFTTLNETYLLTAEKFLDFLNKEKRESIPIHYFRKEAYLIKDSYKPRIDYLKIVDGLIGGN